jgi:DNA invertase Pin-like site-specific DNA recombinase
MALVGYARVSTRDQHSEVQVEMLERAGCERIFAESASGVLARRPEFDAALAYLREGDVLVVTKLDRLGRSVTNLSDIAKLLDSKGIGLKALTQEIDTTTPGGRLFFHLLAAFAEFEHDLIVERTLEGLASARARGRTGGRRPKMTPAKMKQARLMYDSQDYTLQEIADTFGVGKTTIYRYLALSAELDPKEKAS